MVFAVKSPKICQVEGAHCDLCDRSLAVGSEIWPVEPPAAAVAGQGASGTTAPVRRAKGKYWWVHAEPCARAYLGGILAPPPCLKWLARGECAYGDDCFYLHLPRPPHATQAAAVPGAGWAANVAGQQQSASKKRKKIRNTGKCSALRRFLFDTFGGAEGLRRGEGVVDVAGGRGDLSFELLNCLGAPCLVVEPQPSLRLRRCRQVARSTMPA